MSEPVGEELVREVLAGREEAAREFFRRLYPQVARIARNHLSHRHAEEDLCQMIFLRVFQNLDQYSGRVPIEHWVSRVAVNTCLNELKKARARPEVTQADLGEPGEALWARLIDPAAPPEEARQGAQEILRHILAALSPVDRQIVSFLYLEEYSVAETSARMGLSRAVVKIRAFRARQKLNTMIRQFGTKLL